ncbi:MAG: hypothetical protein IJJ80_10370 [Clostridia bacterium]|nr:hypothetical protein [Clostridia bacterium]
MMYLAYPAPDDEEQARSVEPLQAHIRLAIEMEPRRFMMKRRGKIRRLPPARKGSNDPLRLVRRKSAQPRAIKAPAALSGGYEPERLLRDALSEARRHGMTLDILAERVGLSERTLRRRLKTPEVLPLGEYCRIIQAAQGECDGKKNP